MMEDHMQCAICLDLFKIPVTIQCGHTLCKDCISKFWDGKEKDRQDLICPVCKEKFPTRPQLNRNVSLSVLMEAVALNSPTKRDVFTGAVVHMEPEFCERHQKPLVIYCRNDLMCVCYECSVKECKGHDQILVEEGRKNREVCRFMMEDHMQCAICLDPFKIPVTIQCGHTLCKDCISKFWDGKEKDRQDLICPVCKEKFPTRPQLNRNVSLSVLMEAVALNSPTKRDVFTGAVVHMEPEEFCERHQKPLVIYCRNDLMCVCYECSVKECKGHDQILVEEERNNREAGLRIKCMEIAKHQEATERSLLELKENLSQAKVSLQQTSLWVNSKFSQVMKVLAEKQEVTQLFLEQQQELTVLQAEERLAVLQERTEKLAALQEEISSMCSLPHCQLIKDSRFIEVPQFSAVAVDVNTSVLEKLNPVTDVLTRISKLVCEDLVRAAQVIGGQDKESSPQDKRPILAVVPSPATLSCPVKSEGLSAYHCSLTFDPCTANAHLRLSQSNRKAEHLTSGPCPVQADESRFDHTWQVLCLQSFMHGQHYWELEVSKPWAYVGVTYPNIPRKEKGKRCMVGMNELSWSLQLYERQLSAWHDGCKEPITGQLQLNSQPVRIGMLLDYDAGTLTYYGEGQVRLHAFHYAFSQALLPACWIGEGVSITLCNPRD
ncbi:tripartite motif-containing protein 65-like isoform X1 [Xyrauchen texanus]|uniref:tripartite motif-containing protein 65-like isoform X1 n=2 Tax=Xyrauchen texanus TaxID=154827 RepID=UPI0022426F3F|nr:tripartite motif-containing protein 65-like isoform X1 [Xyrauchen texanus]